MRGEPVIQASERLESLIFRETLLKDEIAALKKRAEIYQQLHQNDWSPKVFKAYAQYFGFQTALKVRSILEELQQEELLPSYRKGLDIWDIGAGTLGASLGAVDFFAEKQIKINQIHAVDLDLKPAQWARREYESILPNFSIGQSWTDSEPTSTPRLFLICDVLNETNFDESNSLIARLNQTLKTLTTDDIVMIIEPATKIINQKLLAYRDQQVGTPDRSYHLLLPCTHEKPCPARAQEEWCHEEREFRAPQAFWTLVQKLGFERRSLVFSCLVFGGKKAPFTADHGRVVSRNLKSKGKVEKWICADGKRWKKQLLKRHKTEETAFIHEAPRGSILDCRSTGLLPAE